MLDCSIISPVSNRLPSFIDNSDCLGHRDALSHQPLPEQLAKASLQSNASGSLLLTLNRFRVLRVSNAEVQNALHTMILSILNRQMMNPLTLPLSFLSRPLLGLYVFRQISLSFSHSEMMNKSWTSTEPVIENSGCFARRGPQFSGDTEECRRRQLSPKKPCQGKNIMIGTIPVSLPLPNSTNVHGSSSRPLLTISNTCTESRITSNLLHSVQSNIRLMLTNVDKNLLPRSSPSSVSHYSMSPAERYPASNITRYQDKSSFPNHLWKRSQVGYVERPRSAQRNLNNALDSYKVDPPDVKPFDICRHRRHNSGFDISLPANTESCTEMQEGVPERMILKPGMVLLKHYLSLKNQVELVRTCRKLGRGPGGFYQPGYKDGAKLRLQMMCLGLNWDPQTRRYGNKRSIDGCELPHIPDEFRELTNMAIKEAQNLCEKKFRVTSVEDILPSMSPDICIVNFYTANGRLGLHQDRDESRESLRRGLPVVSFSVGDSAEFLYGDGRDVEKAEKVVLESGDVLIFGGESRLVFHGVSCIIPNSTPRELLEATGLRPGRLNLTFRQF